MMFVYAYVRPYYYLSSVKSDRDQVTPTHGSLIFSTRFKIYWFGLPSPKTTYIQLSSTLIPITQARLFPFCGSCYYN